MSITAFGNSGPKCNYAATDLIVQAASGSMAITGFGDSKPLRTGAITAWSHAGVAAAGAALLALRSADRTGRGQHVDISAQQACNLAASYSLLTAYVDASRIGRTPFGGFAAHLARERRLRVADAGICRTDDRLRSQPAEVDARIRRHYRSVGVARLGHLRRHVAHRRRPRTDAATRRRRSASSSRRAPSRNC